jgi:hypothetical protein
MIFLSGSTTYAQNCATGAIDASSTDVGSVLQTAITNIASTGGTIRITNGTYTYTSTIPAFPKNIPNWLKIIGDGGVILKMSSGAHRAFDFHRVADYDTFQNIWLEGFTVDANNMPGLEHVVLGAYSSNVFLQRINMENITVRNIRTINVVVDLTSASLKENLSFETQQPNQHETIWNYIKNIDVENCDFEGGNVGVMVSGIQAGSSYANMSIFIDGIVINHVKHSLLNPPTQGGSSVSVEVGQGAVGGSVYINDVDSWYSGDPGIEVNNMDYAVISNSRVTDAWSMGYEIDNFSNSTHQNSQRIILDNDQVRLLTAFPVSGPYATGFGIYDASDHVGVGDVLLRDCSFYAVTPTLGYNTGRGAAFRAQSVNGTGHGIRSITMEGFSTIIDNYSNGANSVWLYPVYFNVGFAQTTHVTVNDAYIRVRGTHGSVFQSVMGIYLDGSIVADFNNIIIDVSLTGTSYGESSITGIGIASYGPATSISGIFNRIKINMVDTSFQYGFFMGSSSYLTIPNQILITNCDFSGMTHGVEISYFDTTNAAKVILFSNTMRNGVLNNFYQYTPYSATGKLTITHGDVKWVGLSNLNAATNETSGEGYMQTRMGHPGTLKRLRVYLDSNWLNGNFSIIVRVNGYDTAIAIVVPTGTVGAFTDDTHTVAISQNDLVCYELSSSLASGGYVSVRSISIDFTQ